jgi:hypothetical protein
MADEAIIRRWAKDLGLDSQSDEEDGDTDVMVRGENGTRFEIARADAQTWEIRHRRRLSASEVEREWSIPEDAPAVGDVRSLSPTALLARALHQLALPFPLVTTRVSIEGEHVEVELAAVSYDEGLTRQAFALTLSGLVNAVETLDLVLSSRAEQLEVSAELNARAEARLQEFTSSLTPEGIDVAVGGAQREAPSRQAQEEAPSGADLAPPPAAPAAGWAPTHVAPPGGMYAWTEPDPNQAPASTLPPGLELRTVEMLGAWARVEAVNGWIGWVDGRALVERPG